MNYKSFIMLTLFFLLLLPEPDIVFKEAAKRANPIRCAATMYSAFYKSPEKSAEAEIKGTIAPHTWTQRTSAYPKHHISQNSASWNSKNLWTAWLGIWEKLIELLEDIFYMKR